MLNLTQAGLTYDLRLKVHYISICNYWWTCVFFYLMYFFSFLFGCIPRSCLPENTRSLVTCLKQWHQKYFGTTYSFKCWEKREIQSTIIIRMHVLVNVEHDVYGWLLYTMFLQTTLQYTMLLHITLQYTMLLHTSLLYTIYKVIYASCFIREF